MVCSLVRDAKLQVGTVPILDHMESLVQKGPVALPRLLLTGYRSVGKAT